MVDFHAGLVVLKLEDLLEAKHKPVSKWYPLGEKTQRSGGDGSRGSLQVIAQWRYNKDLDFEPFSVPPQCDFQPFPDLKLRRWRLHETTPPRRRRCGRRRAYAAVSRQTL